MTLKTLRKKGGTSHTVITQAVRNPSPNTSATAAVPAGEPLVKPISPAIGTLEGAISTRWSSYLSGAKGPPYEKVDSPIQMFCRGHREPDKTDA